VSGKESRQHLAAILAAEAARASDLVSTAEHANWPLLDAAREVLRTGIEAHEGRIVEMSGHAVLALFDSAAEAVRAAIDVQQKLGEAAAGVEPASSLPFRIGLHLGEIVERDDGPVHGQGVDIALQLCALAEPGGIAASQSIQSVAQGGIDAAFVDLGERKSSSIATPVRTFRVVAGRVGAAPAGAPAAGRVAPAWLSRWSGAIRRARGVIAVVAAGGVILSGGLGYWNTYRTVRGLPAATPAGHSEIGALPTDAGPLSIVVLPFANLTDDPAQGHLADGLTASVTADLSRISDAFVVGAGTALAFKDKTLKAREVGQQLGVRFVLQGNVQRSSGRIRINAQLTDTTTNAQLWSESFEGESSDLFTLQDRVTTLIGNSMGRELVVRAARESERRSSSPKVTDLLLQARALQIRPQTLVNWQRVEALCRQAIALDPANIDATLMLAKSLALQGKNFGLELGIEAWVSKVDEAANLSSRVRDSSAGPDDPRLYEVLGMVAQLRGDFEATLRAYQSRLTLEPKSPEAHVELANAYYHQAEPKRAEELLTRALALDPKYPLDSVAANLSWVEFMLGNSDGAIEWGLKAQAANPTWYARYTTLATAYAMKGDHAKAAAAAAAAFEANRGNTISGATYMLDFPLVPVHPAYRTWALQHVIPAMRLAGFPE
jgi:TolB-like protein/class 3 adenylate cyclase